MVFTTAVQVSQFHSEVDRERGRIREMIVKTFMFTEKMLGSFKLKVDYLPIT